MQSSRKSYDPKILAYLKKPNNLPLVLQIADYAAKIREDIPNEIWCDIVKKLNASRPKMKLADDLEFDRPINAVLTKQTLNLQPWKSGRRAATKLVFDIEMNKAEHEFYVWIGAGWLQGPQKRNSPIYRIPEIIKLRTAMEDDSDGYEFSPPDWLCGRYTWPSSSREKFLSEGAEKKNEIVETTVTSFWRMVRKHFAQVEGVNKRLHRLRS
jgi:hypothetical protein